MIFEQVLLIADIKCQSFCCKLAAWPEKQIPLSDTSDSHSVKDQSFIDTVGIHYVKYILKTTKKNPPLTSEKRNLKEKETSKDGELSPRSYYNYWCRI